MSEAYLIRKSINKILKIVRFLLEKVYATHPKIVALTNALAASCFSKPHILAITPDNYFGVSMNELTTSVQPSAMFS